MRPGSQASCPPRPTPAPQSHTEPSWLQVGLPCRAPVVQVLETGAATLLHAGIRVFTHWNVLRHICANASHKESSDDRNRSREGPY